MDLRKIDLRTEAQQVDAATIELSDEQLSSVSGGKGKASAVLMKACAHGEHIREATITC
jgi:bacteriocin-like protein